MFGVSEPVEYEVGQLITLRFADRTWRGLISEVRYEPGGVVTLTWWLDPEDEKGAGRD